MLGVRRGRAPGSRDGDGRLLVSGVVIAPAVRIHRARALGLLLVAALAVTSTACNPGRPPAATVGGIDISSERVDDLVGAFAAADASFRDDIAGQGDGTYDSAWAADALRILVTRAAAAALADERNAIVDSTHRDGAEDELAASLLPDDPEKGAAVVAALPAGTRAWLLELTADGLALQADLATDGAASSEQARSYYESSDEFDRVCLRLLVVAPDEVEAAQARLDAGEDFGDLSAELSLDPQVAEARGGGDCTLLSQLQQQLQPEAFQEISGVPDGGVVGPFQYDEVGNVVLVDVSPREKVPFEEVAEQIAANLPGDARLDVAVREALGRIEIRIDPRFGRWDEEGHRVVAPSGSGR